MNTVTQQENAALAAAFAPFSQERVLVPLSQLSPSARNVRPAGGTAIAELAASILRLGLLQNLNVVPSRDGTRYEVVAGRRRLAALKLLVKRRLIARDVEVPCCVVAEAAARTVSLSENVQREAMHPIDQFEAFAALVAEGRPIEDIAADFGVTPLVVQRRLRLANVSPRLRADYREGVLTLEQLMALAVSDDHAAQEAAFYDVPDWQRSPDALREHLTCDEVDAARDPLALYVGLPAYEADGGGVRRDLFAEDAQGAFLTDPALLERLAREKLAPVAEQVRGEGWAWVEVLPRATAGELHLFQRAPRTRREASKAEAKRIAALRKKQDALQDRLDEAEDDMTDAQAQAVQEEIDRTGEELEALEQSMVVFADEVRALAGAVVSLDHAGGVVVHRGLLQEAQAKTLRAQQRAAAAKEAGASGTEDVPEASGISEKLARRLSAHRTAALQAEVARHPQVALAALVHRLAFALVLDEYGDGGSPLQLHVAAQFGLAQHAPDLEDAPASTGLQAVRTAWAQRLPRDSDALFAALVAMPQDELLKLLAVCVACSVDAVTPRAEALPARALAEAVGLDMHAWWAPTASGYFEHVAKAKVLEAVQSFAPGERGRLERLKKAELSAEAGRLAAGTDWLPAMLRAVPAPLAAPALSQADEVA